MNNISYEFDHSLLFLQTKCKIVYADQMEIVDNTWLLFYQSNEYRVRLLFNARKTNSDLIN